MAVVEVFVSDDKLFLLMKLLNHICQFQGAAYQAVESGRQLIKGRLLQPLVIELAENRFAAFQHLQLQVAEKPGALALAALVMGFAQLGFARAPLGQRIHRDLQGIAGCGDIAVQAVYQIESLNFGVKRITTSHRDVSFR